MRNFVNILFLLLTLSISGCMNNGKTDSGNVDKRILVSSVDPYSVGFSKTNRYHYLVVGTGETHEAALVNARKEIANAIESHIITLYKDQKIYDGKELKELVESQIMIESNAILHFLPRILKEEIIDGRYRLEVFYDSTPKVIQLRNLSMNSCDYEKPRYFVQFEESLNLDKGKCLPPFILDAESGLFQLLFKNGRVVVDRKVINSLFRPYQQSPILSVINSPNLIKDGENYSINVTVDRDGYLSLVYLGQNSQSAIFIDNKKVDSVLNNKLTFPDPNGGRNMVSELPSGLSLIHI